MTVQLLKSQERVNEPLMRSRNMWMLATISAIESCWHIFEFPMHAEKTNCLFIWLFHLPDQQLVYYNPDDVLDEIVDRQSSQKTTLTAWFDANKNHPTS